MNFGQVDFVWDNISVAVRVSSVKPPADAHVRELMVEWIGPVCSPQYRESAGLDSLEALARAHLLATKTRLEAWDDWIDASAYSGTRFVVSERFEHFYLLIQAAICGLGVAVVPQMLVLDDLRSGKLVAPFGFVASRRNLQLWIAPHLDGRSDVEALAGWLTAQMKATAASGSKGRSSPKPISGLSPCRSRHTPA